MGMKTVDNYKVTESSGRDLNKPTEPKWIKAGATMRRLHEQGGARKAPHK